MNNTNTQIVNNQSTINFSEDDRRFALDDETNESPIWYREELCKSINTIRDNFYRSVEEYKNKCLENNDIFKEALEHNFTRRFDDYIGLVNTYLVSKWAHSFQNLQLITAKSTAEMSKRKESDVKKYGNEAEDIHMIMFQSYMEIFGLLKEAKEKDETGIYF